MNPSARKCFLFAVAATFAVSGFGGVARGKSVHVPKRCPVKAHTAPDATVFSSPDAQDDVLPGFVGKKGQPLNMEMDRVYAFDPWKLLGNLTEDQKKQMKAVQDSTSMNVQAMQEHIAVLNQKLDVVKAHPSLKVWVQHEPLEATKLREEIAELRKRISDKRRDSTQQLEAILTDAQRDQLQRMRHGEFIHDTPEMERKESEK